MDAILTSIKMCPIIIAKVTRNIGILYPIFNRPSPVPIQTRINLLKMYVTPTLIFPGTAWVLYISNDQCRKIEAVHRIGVRIILGLSTIVNNIITLITSRLPKIQDTVHAQFVATFWKKTFAWHENLRELDHAISATPPTKTKIKKNLLNEP